MDEAQVPLVGVRADQSFIFSLAADVPGSSAPGLKLVENNSEARDRPGPLLTSVHSKVEDYLTAYMGASATYWSRLLVMPRTHAP